MERGNGNCYFIKVVYLFYYCKYWEIERYRGVLKD